MARRPNKPRTALTRTGRWRSAFLAALAEGENVTLAAKAAGIDRGTAYERRGADPAFAKAWDSALEVAIDALEAEARRRAYEGVLVKRFTKSGEPVIDPATGEQYVERVYSDRLMEVLLRAHRPARFRDNHTHVHEGGIRTVADGEAAADQVVDRLVRALGLGAAGAAGADAAG